jgi:transcriptional regulator with XRE-family HTH domain
MEEELAKIRREFGDWIRGKIDKAGLKYTVVAEAVGITPVQLSRILSGDSGTKAVIAVALAERVGADPREALDRAGFSRRILGPDLIQEIVDELNTLPVEQQKDVLDFVKFWRQRSGKTEPAPMPTRAAAPIHNSVMLDDLEESAEFLGYEEQQPEPAISEKKKKERA